MEQRCRVVSLRAIKRSSWKERLPVAQATVPEPIFVCWCKLGMGEVRRCGLARQPLQPPCAWIDLWYWPRLGIQESEWEPSSRWSTLVLMLGRKFWWDLFSPCSRSDWKETFPVQLYFVNIYKVTLELGGDSDETNIDNRRRYPVGRHLRRISDAVPHLPSPPQSSWLAAWSLLGPSCICSCTASLSPISRVLRPKTLSTFRILTPSLTLVVRRPDACQQSSRDVVRYFRTLSIWVIPSESHALRPPWVLLTEISRDQ